MPQTCECMAVLAADSSVMRSTCLEAAGASRNRQPDGAAVVLDYSRSDPCNEGSHTLAPPQLQRVARLTKRQLRRPNSRGPTAQKGRDGIQRGQSRARPAGGVHLQKVWAIPLGEVEYAYKRCRRTEAAEDRPQLQQDRCTRNEPLLPSAPTRTSSSPDPRSTSSTCGSDHWPSLTAPRDIARDLFSGRRFANCPLRRTTRPAPLAELALSDVARSSWRAGAPAGGVRTLRDFPGSGRDPAGRVATKTQARATCIDLQGGARGRRLSISPALPRRWHPDFGTVHEAAGGPTPSRCRSGC
jgi:hypothetical protein